MHNEAGAAASPAESGCRKEPCCDIRRPEYSPWMRTIVLGVYPAHRNKRLRVSTGSMAEGQTPAIRKHAGHAAVPNANGDTFSPADGTQGLPRCRGDYAWRKRIHRV
jgi:hypothetical protein